MKSDLQLTIDANKGRPGEDIIPSIDQCLKDAYPGLQTRWSRVYGRRRWAHIYGTSERLTLNPMRVELGASYGLYIDNPELIPQDDLDNIISLLQSTLG